MRAEFTLDYDVLTVEQPQRLYLMARFASGSAPDAGRRRPLNLSLVIDRSGSMAGTKIDYTRQAAQFLVQHLGKQDTLSVVLYNDQVETLLHPTNISNKDRIAQLLADIKVRGTTNLSGGWLEGCAHVGAGISPDTLNRVILMSDGLANRGVTDQKQLISMAQQKYEAGISTTTMGLGKDFNEDLMMAFADAGGGAFYFIESPEVAPVIFQEELSGLLKLVGQNLTIQVRPTEHVQRITQLHAYPAQREGRNVRYRMGDIFGEEIKTLVLEFDIPGLKDIGEQAIATLRFEYDEITDDGSVHQQIEVPVTVNVRPSDEQLPPPDAEVARSVLLLKAAQARREAVQAADQGDYKGAAQRLHQVAESITDSPLSDAQLEEERDALLQQAKRMERGPVGFDEYSRKSISTQAYYTMTSRHDETVVLRHRESRRDAPSTARQTEKIRATPHPQPPVAPQPGSTPTHVRWQGRLYPLHGDLIRIGRAPQNEIVISEKGVSRFHAQIRRDASNGNLILDDLDSTNGTHINNQRITGGHVLSVGDRVFACDAELVFLSPPDNKPHEQVNQANANTELDVDADNPETKTDT